MAAMPDTPAPRRSRRVFLLVAVLVVGAGVVALYVAFLRGSSTKRLALSPSPPSPAGGAGSTAGPAPSTLAGTWKAGAGSTAGYRVREKLAELPAQSDAVGRTTGVTGSVALESAGSGLRVATADLTVDLSTLTSDRTQRDRAIQRRGLQITTFPTAHFVLTQPVALPATATDGQAFTVQATGDLTLHGQTKPETIPIQARLKGTQIDLVGSTTFPMADFGITPPDIGGFVSVEPNATLEFEVLLDRA